MERACGVCGDKAFGFNFNAITCESCKAFFRRNALRNINFRCSSSTNQCEIDKKNRKFCRKCRLTKCYKIGMRKELIMTNDEKKILKQNLRKYSESTDNVNTDSVCSPSSSTCHTNNNSNSECLYLSDKICDRKPIVILPIMPMFFSSNPNQTTLNSSPVEMFDSKKLIEDIRKHLNEFSSFSSLLKPEKLSLNDNSSLSDIFERSLNSENAIYDEILHLPSDRHIRKCGYLWEISHSIYKHAYELESTFVNQNDLYGKSTIRLSPIELQKLDEVNRHFREMLMIVMGHNQKIITRVEIGMKYFESVFAKLVMTIKNIHSFKSMCQDDQIALLKGSAHEIKCLLNIKFYNDVNDAFELPNFIEKDSMLVLNNSYFTKIYGEEFYTRVKNFILSFRTDWKEESIINLLSMVLLFYPNKLNLVHREHIKLEFFSYCKLLLRYLFVKYGSICEAKTIYLNLLSRLEEMHLFNEQCIELILKFDPKIIGPLTNEVLDLNNKKKHITKLD